MKSLLLTICIIFSYTLVGQDTEQKVPIPEQPKDSTGWLNYARYMYFAFGTDNCPQQTLYNYLIAHPIQDNVLYDAYLGVSKLAISECDKGLFSKLAAWKKAKVGFDSIVDSNPNNIEIHFLQLGIAIHAPSIANYGDNVTPDQKKLINGIISDPNCFNDKAYTVRVIDWIFKHITNLTSEQRQELTAIKNKMSQ